MREADRDEELVAVFGAELGADPLAIGGRATAYVDCDVEDAAANAADELVLAARRGLEVQAAKGVSGSGERMVVLHEGAGDAELGEGGD